MIDEWNPFSDPIFQSLPSTEHQTGKKNPELESKYETHRRTAKANDHMVNNTREPEKPSYALKQNARHPQLFQ